MGNGNININSSEDFETVISNLTRSLDTIKDALGYEENSSKRFKDKDIWDGKAGESISKKIDEYKMCFPTMIESLESYIKFLKETLENYKKADETINSSADSNASELMVN